MAKKSAAGSDDVLQVVSDLAAMIAERFDKVDQRFDKVDQRFDKMEIQLFKQGEDIKELQTGLKEANFKIDHLYGALDSHMKRIEDIMQENKIRDHQQERMERWIFQMADKIGLKLKYD